MIASSLKVERHQVQTEAFAFFFEQVMRNLKQE